MLESQLVLVPPFVWLGRQLGDAFILWFDFTAPSSLAVALALVLAKKLRLVVLVLFIVFVVMMMVALLPMPILRSFLPILLVSTIKQ